MTGAVFVVGAAMLPMGKYPDASYAGLALPPLLEACRIADVNLTDIQMLACGHAFGGPLTGQRIIKEVGLGGIPVINIDNACSGGATAMQVACRAIASGEHDLALVVGVEKLSQFGGGALPLSAEDPEARRGMVMPALYAMRARRHMHERGTTSADLAAVSVKARKHGALNPFAQIRKPTTIEEVLASRPVADPLTLFQCCPTGDGAAAVVLASERAFRRRRGRALRIRASVLHSGVPTGGFRDMLRPEISAQCARDAYEQAAVGPEDLQLVELHDAFTIAELVYYEALGLCAPGESLALLHSGATSLGGRLVVNPSGGLLAKGHPVGASGVAQVVETFWHLTGNAGERQVEGARTALTHVTGGGISGLDHGACAVHVFERA